MGTITAFESISLDGVMQGPGRQDEDTRGGFRHGGWGIDYADEVIGNFAATGMGTTVAMLFGHRTYDDLLQHWTSVTEPNPYTDALVNQQKYVVSRNSATELAYPNSTLLAGEAAETVARLKDDITGGITILGSGELVRALHAAGLVDQYVLMIHPTVLGSGTQLFGDADRANLKLEESLSSTTGVVIGRYRM